MGVFLSLTLKVARTHAHAHTHASGHTHAEVVARHRLAALDAHWHDHVHHGAWQWAGFYYMGIIIFILIGMIMFIMVRGSGLGFIIWVLLYLF